MKRYWRYDDSRPDKERAMSLIEILLVIAVLSTLSVVGIGMLQREAEAQKVEKTVQQFQALIVAAKSYYEYQADWPDVTDLTAFAPNIAQNGMTNPWGNVYNLALTTTSTLPQITTRVPTQQIAQLIVARLPFGQFINCPAACQVNATLTVPSKLGWLYGVDRLPKIYDFTEASIVSTVPYTVTVPTQKQCKAGYNPKWVAGVKAFTRLTVDNSTNWLGGFFLCRKSNNTVATENTCQFFNRNPSFDNELNFLLWSGSAELSYDLILSTATAVIMTYCEPQ